MLLSTLHRIDKLLSMELELLNPEPGGGVSDELSQKIIDAADECANELINIYRAQNTTAATRICGTEIVRMNTLSRYIKTLAGKHQYPAVKKLLETKLKTIIHIGAVVDDKKEIRTISFVDFVKALFGIEIISADDMKSRLDSSRIPDPYTEVLRDIQPDGPGNA